MSTTQAIPSEVHRDPTLRSLAYLVALLTDEQRWDLAGTHAALLRQHDRFFSASDLHRLYTALAAAGPRAREVGQ